MDGAEDGDDGDGMICIGAAITLAIPLSILVAGLALMMGFYANRRESQNGKDDGGETGRGKEFLCFSCCTE